MFTLCFMMGELHGWGTFPKRGWSWLLPVLGTLIWKCPHSPWGLTLHRLFGEGQKKSGQGTREMKRREQKSRLVNFHLDNWCCCDVECFEDQAFKVKKVWSITLQMALCWKIGNIPLSVKYVSSFIKLD